MKRPESDRIHSNRRPRPDKPGGSEPSRTRSFMSNERVVEWDLVADKELALTDSLLIVMSNDYFTQASITAIFESVKHAKRFIVLSLFQGVAQLLL
jgi:hypothetical protein